MTNAFNTQDSLNRGRGRGGHGRGRRGLGSPATENISSHSHEHSDNLEHSHNSQVQRGRSKRWTNKSYIQCNYGKKYGHDEQECRKMQDDQNNNRANVPKEEGSSKVMFMSYKATEEYCSTYLWLRDSGC